MTAAVLAVVAAAESNNALTAPIPAQFGGGSGGGSGGGGSGTTPQAPQAPTIEDATPGAGTIAVTWRLHSDDADRTITRWQIRLNRITYTTSNLGITTQTATPVPLPDVNVTDGTADQHTHTIKGLDFDTEYRIEVSGYLGTTAGTYSTPETATTNPEAVRLVALEVTQGLQNWNHNITLVKGKRTVVRAFLEPTSGTDITVDVKLQAVVDGRVVATASPQNPDTQTGPPSEYNEYLFTVRDGAAAGRAMLGASANFLLDLDVPPTRQEWVGGPSGQPNLSLPGSSHSVTYRLVVDDGVVCEAAAAESDSSAPPGTACKADLEFRYVHTPTVRLVGVGYDDGTGTIEVPTRDHLDEQARRILSVMPIPALDYNLRQLNHPYATAPDFTDVPTPLLSRLLHRHRHTHRRDPRADRHRHRSRHRALQLGRGRARRRGHGSRRDGTGAAARVPSGLTRHRCVGLPGL